MKASKNVNKVSLYIAYIKKYFSCELYINIITSIFAMIDNNKFSLILSFIAFGYNIYSRIKKIHNFNIIIGDRKTNLKDANRVSFLYKIKFVLYTIVTMYAVTVFIFNCFGTKKIIKNFNIINSL